jgi:hypothetical protein
MHAAAARARSEWSGSHFRGNACCAVLLIYFVHIH